MRKSLVVFGGLVGVLLVLVLISFYLKKKGAFEGFASEATEVTYFFLPECPWCKKFEPEWVEFEKKATAEGIQTKKVDGSDPKNKDLVVSKKIQGFPTVIVSKNGKESEYSGDRKADDLLKYVKTA